MSTSRKPAVLSAHEQWLAKKNAEQIQPQSSVASPATTFVAPAQPGRVIAEEKAERGFGRVWVK